MKYCAVVLLGPTAAGKTPLGDYFAEKGVQGRRCYHFDFGAELRRIDRTHGADSDLAEEDLAYVSRVLRSGALLEEQTFYIAEGILRSFVENRKISNDDLILLNGLPRHLSQAERLQEIVEPRCVLYLECPAPVVLERIRHNSGGDRAGREDDQLAAVEKRLETFRQRTLPLLDYYRARNVPLHSIRIGVQTEAAEIYDSLQLFLENP